MVVRCGKISFAKALQLFSVIVFHDIFQRLARRRAGLCAWARLKALVTLLRPGTWGRFKSRGGSWKAPGPRLVRLRSVARNIFTQGQQLALVVADNYRAAKRGAQAVQVKVAGANEGPGAQWRSCYSWRSNIYIYIYDYIG